MSPTSSDGLRDLLALHLAPGLGPCRTAALLQHFGSAARARRAGAAELCAVDGIGPKLAEQLARALPAVDVDGELRQVERAGVRLVALGTPEYPAALAQISDPPQLLYVRGTLTEADALAVALVGSRGCSEYGRRTAARLAAGLARAGVTVVSGLARGVDGVAHRAALEVNSLRVGLSSAPSSSTTARPDSKGLSFMISPSVVGREAGPPSVLSLRPRRRPGKGQESKGRV